VKCIIYARYSSDGQREESIEGQLRECKEFAERHNMTMNVLRIEDFRRSHLDGIRPAAGSICGTLSVRHFHSPPHGRPASLRSKREGPAQSFGAACPP
jgi:hypothetical protein